MNRELFDPPGIVRSVESLAELAGRINAEHHQLGTAMRAGLEHARRAGELLLEAKEQCCHGQWLNWLKANVHLTARTAQRYMAIAARWDELTGKYDSVSHLSYRETLQVLAAPSTDEDAADEPKRQHVWHLPNIHLPALRPGYGYVVDGHSQRFGECFAAIDPHPDHPGSWVYLFDFGCQEDWGFTEYCGRGVRLDANLLTKILQRTDFTPDGPWEETDPDPEPPAIGWYREWLRRSMN
jgi:hypothetical protein